MPERIPQPRRAQIWAARLRSRRHFLVTDVLPNGDVRGMTYLQHDSATRTTTLTPAEFHALYRLLEDVPAHLAAKEAADA
ncbi:hypothetical protein [Streptosporangium sp. G12]